MGKAGYKRFKKQEKAKVKLKGNKTLLPKGQNVTDTSFKVKKIVVKEQLKGHGENEILTRKHLNIKDLIVRLSHHNLSMRQDALSGLKELISAHGSDTVLPNLSQLLQATMSLTVDIESEVRKETVKLLSIMFKNVSEEELSPLFPVVVCHLTCAMTHIEPSVRSDSLRLLDIILDTLPALTAAHTPTLLPHFLDLISQRSNTGTVRTLSLNLDGRITSEKWRAKVIGRLNRLFGVILDHIKKDQKQLNQRVQWTSEKPTYLKMYSPTSFSSKAGEDVNNIPIQEYAEMLMPLLLDSFTEAVPKQIQEDSESSCVVGIDVAGLLQSISEIIINICNLLNRLSSDNTLSEWFLKTWGEPVAMRMMKGKFPFSVMTATSRKRRRDTNEVLAALNVDVPSCTLLNLQLCLLTFLLTPPGELWTQSVQYIKRTLRNGQVKPEEGAVLCQCLEAASLHRSTDDTLSLLGALARNGMLNGVNKPVNKRVFDYLTSIALLPSHQLHSDKHFITWLDVLPALLCKPAVSLSTVKSLAAISARNLPAFSNSLDGWIEEILTNLPTLQVIGDSGKEGPKLVVDMMYWVTDWDEEFVGSLKNMICHAELGVELTSHMLEVLKFRSGSSEEIEKMLEEITPR